MDLYSIRQELNSGKSIYDLQLRVVYYARVSTDTEEQLHSIQNQISYYEDYIRNNKNWTFAGGYIDEGISGTSVEKRDNFLKMINDAKDKKFDFIVTKEISRFSRNTLDSIKYTQQLLSYGIGVLFQSDNINTLMPDAELRLTIMSSIAQDEVRKLSERVKFGFRRSIDNGIVLGNDNIWGYKKDKGKLVIVEEEAKMIRLVFDMYANQRLGVRAICNELYKLGYRNSKDNIFSFSTIKNIITNPKYKGYYCGRKTHKVDYKLSDIKHLDSSEWIMYKDETGEIVPAIVSEELWEKANKIFNRRSKEFKLKNKTTSYNNKYPYSAKIICMEHNTSFHRREYKYKSGNKELWVCKKYSEKGLQGCSSPTIYTKELDEIMKQALNLMIENKSDIIHDLINIYSSIGSKTKIKEEVTQNQNKINDILKMKDKLLDLSIKGRITDDEFEIRNNKFNEQISELKETIEQLNKQEEKNTDILRSAEVLKKIISNELNFDNGLSNSLVDEILDRIEVHKTEEENVINLKVYFKISNESIPFTISRKQRGKTSFCYNSAILFVANRSIKIKRRLNNPTRSPYDQIFNTEFFIAI